MNESPDQAKNRERRSLVERAAEKIVVDRGVRSAPEPDRASAPEVQEAAAAALAQMPPFVEDETEDSLLAQGAADATLQEAALADDQRPVSSSEPAAKLHKRNPKVAKIDIPGLMARKILTPQTKRNRTLEEIRLIKRMVLSRRWDEGDRPGNTIIVTSALPSEGKTTTAINLAMSIAAEEDLRVLLVDADFIRADALRQLGVSAQKGLIDVLENPRMDVSDVMLNTDIDKLTLIPSGQLHERCTELLASSRMHELISELANRYEDRILIFDSPPILATTESVVLSSHMGQVVVVVQAGRTSRESVQSALELIDERQRVGLVLNRATARFGKVGFGAYYDSYYYGYRKGGEARS